MTLNLLAKYAAGAAIVGSLFYLVLDGSLSSEQYALTATGILIALGALHRPGSSTANAAVPEPVTSDGDDK